MPDFAFTFGNNGDVTQEWTTVIQADFNLEPGQTMPVNFEVNQNIVLAIVVDAANENATCNLTYTNANQTWTFQSPTPNEFQFAFNVQNRTVNLGCSLSP